MHRPYFAAQKKDNGRVANHWAGWSEGKEEYNNIISPPAPNQRHRRDCTTADVTVTCLDGRGGDEKYDPTLRWWTIKFPRRMQWRALFSVTPLNLTNGITNIYYYYYYYTLPRHYVIPKNFFPIIVITVIS